jgi:hypothetical protein
VKFIVFVIDTATNTGNSEELREIDAFNETLRASGQLVMAAGIGSPDRANLFDFTGQRTIQEKASLFSSPEFYSGFWIIEAASKEQAEDLAKQASHACNRKVELRPFLGS